MKDAETLILKAFFAALYQQRAPLSEAINNQLREIAQSWETRILDLHDLAVNSPALVEFYKDARRCLTSAAAERGMGLNLLPADEIYDDDNFETPNISRDTRPAIEKTKQLFAAIEAKLDSTPQVLSAPNPVQAAKQMFKL